MTNPISQRLNTHFKNQLAPEGYKWCPDCEDYQPVTEFGKGASYCNTHKRARGKADYVKRKQRQREAIILKTYGLTPDGYSQLLESQGGKCAICRRELRNGKATHIDHCHDTGRIRGLLCHSCNTGLGMFGDDAKRLKSAISYLSREGSPPYQY